MLWWSGSSMNYKFRATPLAVEKDVTDVTPKAPKWLTLLKTNMTLEDPHFQ